MGKKEVRPNDSWFSSKEHTGDVYEDGVKIGEVHEFEGGWFSDKRTEVRDTSGSVVSTIKDETSCLGLVEETVVRDSDDKRQGTIEERDGLFDCLGPKTWDFVDNDGRRSGSGRYEKPLFGESRLVVSDLELDGFSKDPEPAVPQKTTPSSSSSNYGYSSSSGSSSRSVARPKPKTISPRQLVQQARTQEDLEALLTYEKDPGVERLVREKLKAKELEPWRGGLKSNIDRIDWDCVATNDLVMKYLLNRETNIDFKKRIIRSIPRDNSLLGTFIGEDPSLDVRVAAANKKYHNNPFNRYCQPRFDSNPVIGVIGGWFAMLKNYLFSKLSDWIEERVKGKEYYYKIAISGKPYEECSAALKEYICEGGNPRWVADRAQHTRIRLSALKLVKDDWAISSIARHDPDLGVAKAALRMLPKNNRWLVQVIPQAEHPEIRRLALYRTDNYMVISYGLDDANPKVAQEAKKRFNAVRGMNG